MTDPGLPGRFCPARYACSADKFARPPDLTADALYIIGGLYGNEPALDAIEALALNEPDPPTLVFNGDFHWFDVDPASFERIDARVGAHRALAGNVEAELATDAGDAGCGCAYPAEVDDATVARSNHILARLRETAKGFPARRRGLGALAMTALARVGDARVAIVHGDAESLAGWRFSVDALDDPRNEAWLADIFERSRVDIFASTHSCLPVMRVLGFAQRRGCVANNGAAGMPNFSGSRQGLITRIGLSPAPCATLYGAVIAGVFVEALAVPYDASAWAQRFLADWPAGSAAHESYWSRIAEGPRYAIDRARPVAVIESRAGY